MKNAKDIQQMFDNIAKNYDILNNIISFNMHSFVKKKAIKNANLKNDSKVLDVCTGTGDIAIYIAKNVLKNKGGTVTGADFSENMLELARKKAKGIENIKFVTADALNLPFEDGEFDASFISFGLRNLTDLRKGLLEMKRVTKPGGLVVNVDTGKPKGIFKFIFNLYFFKIVPIMGKVFNGNATPYKYLPQSTEEFPSQEELVQIFEEIGLRKVQKHDFMFGTISEQIGEV